MEERKNSRWIDVYFSKLEKCGVEKDSVGCLREKYGDLLASASFAANADSGMAYEGSMIEVSLTRLAAYAVKLNAIYPKELRADVPSIVKVCLLKHISKAVRMKKSTNDWRIKNLGEVYTYDNSQPAIGVGLHSLIMASECGIPFTPMEAEAMTIDDKADDDMQAKYHSSVLSSVVRQAGEMVRTEAEARRAMAMQQ